MPQPSRSKLESAQEEIVEISAALQGLGALFRGYNGDEESTQEFPWTGIDAILMGLVRRLQNVSEQIDPAVTGSSQSVELRARP